MIDFLDELLEIAGPLRAHWDRQKFSAGSAASAGAASAPLRPTLWGASGQSVSTGPVLDECDSAIRDDIFWANARM